MDRICKPYIQTSKNHESRLGQYRIKAGLKVSELADLAEVSQGRVADFQNNNGSSPIYEKYYQGNLPGSWKPDALKIVEIINDKIRKDFTSKHPHVEHVPNITMEDVFPKYAAKIDSYKPTQEETASASGWGDEIVISPEENYIQNEKSEIFKNTIKTKLNNTRNQSGRTDKRMWEILERRVVYGDTLDEVSNQYNISRERISQIEKKAIKILRNSGLESQLTKLLEN
ncbi:MAG: hypothetical protein OEL87_01765 [Nanoarchaeota archaeon]|nr:hypothetical protein [Nanoarchaeota archaeon]